MLTVLNFKRSCPLPQPVLYSPPSSQLERESEMRAFMSEKKAVYPQQDMKRYAFTTPEGGVARRRAP